MRGDTRLPHSLPHSLPPGRRAETRRRFRAAPANANLPQNISDVSSELTASSLPGLQRRRSTGAGCASSVRVRAVQSHRGGGRKEASTRADTRLLAEDAGGMLNLTGPYPPLPSNHSPGEQDGGTTTSPHGVRVVARGKWTCVRPSVRASVRACVRGELRTVVVV